MAAMIAREIAARAAAPARTLAADLLAFALPQRCPGCGAAAAAYRLLCERCFDSIPPIGAPLCTRCLAREREAVGCRAHAGFEAWAARVYDERAACLVHALKYGSRRALAPALADAIAAALPSALAPDAVTGVPLHPARRRERGFDQAALLAEALADRVGAPYLAGALRRTRPTPPQVGRSAMLRRRNVSGAFEVSAPARLRGRRVLVVDDVLTTGATLEACLAALRDAGAHGTGAAFAWAA
jgi:ComF family protein